MPSSPESPEVAVIGGSGLYQLLDDPITVEITTPYGAPSAPVVLGEVAGRSVAFLPRHGLDHQLPPHRIPYRANLWALHSLGVRQVLAPCAVGSLRPEVPAGTVVVPDQLVDRTSGRPQTFFDGPRVLHASFADPYCPVVRQAALAAAGSAAIDGGTMVVVEGPRFSTRAESQSFAAAGWSLINMTGQPEAVLARELGMCFAALALVTDVDAGVAVGEGVTHAEVFRVFRSNMERVRTMVLAAVAELPLTGERTCACAAAVDGDPEP